MKKFLNFVHDPLEELKSIAQFKFFYETGWEGVSVKNGISTYLAFRNVYSPARSLCNIFFIIILHGLNRFFTPKKLSLCAKVCDIKCFCLKCSGFFVINEFFHYWLGFLTRFFIAAVNLHVHLNLLECNGMCKLIRQENAPAKPSNLAVFSINMYYILAAGHFCVDNGRCV